MIVLGGITLPDVWFDPEMRFGDTGLDSRFVMSRAGSPIVWEAPVGARAQDLIGGGDTAWMTHAVLVSLFDLAALPGATYTLDYEGAIYTCRFRNWDPPVISAAARIGRPNPDDGDYYRNIRIRLMVHT